MTKSCHKKKEDHVLVNHVVDVFNLFKGTLRQVLGEQRCDIRFHGRPNRNWI